MGAASSPRVFVSYGHEDEEHAERVLTLAHWLRSEGIDARLDRYEVDPPEGWPAWTRKQILDSDFVVMVCTPAYRRRFERDDAGASSRGVAWEAAIAEQLLYEAGARNETLIPVLLAGGRDEDVPLVLRAYTRYRLPEQNEGLLRRITGQKAIEAPPLGTIRTLPPRAQPVLGKPTEARSHDERGGAQGQGDPITDEQLVDELARVLWTSDEAVMVARRVGFSPARIPRFETSLVFWSHMVEAAGHGAIPGGVQSIAKEAARLYPGNRVFPRYRAP